MYDLEEERLVAEITGRGATSSERGLAQTCSFQHPPPGVLAIYPSTRPLV
jgi:hypothetical protein